MTPESALKPQYLRVTNYEKYQHYKDRRPIWVKFYVELLDDYDLNRQKSPTRLLAVMLLLVAATQDNRIPYDPEWLAQELHMSVGSVAAGLESLVTIGFLSMASRKHSASSVLAKRSQDAIPEKSKRKRDKEPKAVLVPRPDALPDAVERPSDFTPPTLREIA